jgi:micrococcal nuclease|tara:strand:- start:897 stop:1256 length:360 start_codon:yes stop_codon:yes gene_type:complete
MYTYNAKLDRVVDGDTVDALVDLGFNTWKKVRIRLYRIDAWESRTRDAKEKIKGFAAKNRLIEILKNNDNKFTLISHGVGKFGRCLGEMFIGSTATPTNCINDLLVLEGHAKRYDDKKK